MKLADWSSEVMPSVINSEDKMNLQGFVNRVSLGQSLEWAGYLYLGLHLSLLSSKQNLGLFYCLRWETRSVFFY